jgi:hypothetical protein
VTSVLNEVQKAHTDNYAFWAVVFVFGLEMWRKAQLLRLLVCFTVCGFENGGDILVPPPYFVSLKGFTSG